MSQVLKFRKKVESHFGTCPYCLKTDGYLNNERHHWFVCDEHQAKWYVGSNLFSCWREESEALWAANRTKLDDYKMVECSRWEYLEDREHLIYDSEPF